MLKGSGLLGVTHTTESPTLKPLTVTVTQVASLMTFHLPDAHQVFPDIPIFIPFPLPLLKHKTFPGRVEKTVQPN